MNGSFRDEFKNKWLQRKIKFQINNNRCQVTK